MAVDLLAVLERATGLRQAARTNGGEYAGPCPFCGGDDRFRAWPYADRPRWWCRRCWRKGDAIDFLRQYEGLSFREACARLGRDPDAPRIAANVAEALSPMPEDVPPSAEWQRRMGTFVCLAQDCLWSPLGEEPLAYLRNERSLTDETIRGWQLGYNPTSGPLRAVEWASCSETSRLWAPEGIVIPCEVGRALWSVKVRRLESAARARYGQVTGSRAALFGTRTLRPAGRPHQVVVLTEGEFDAMLLHQEAGDLVGVVTMGSVTAPLTPAWLWELRDARRILVAYDIDQAGVTGAARVAAASARMRVVRPIGGKDLTEMHRAGGDLRAWALFHLRKHGRTESSAAV